MKCSYHPEREAVGKCIDCGKNICRLCLTTTAFKISESHLTIALTDKHYCPSCIDKLLQKTMNNEGTETVRYTIKTMGPESISGLRFRQQWTPKGGTISIPEVEFTSDVIEETVIEYHIKKLEGAKCTNCEQETLYKYDDGKIRCKTCGETRPI